MKVAVFGSSGFIGRHVAFELERNHEVYLATSQDMGKKNSYQVSLLDQQSIVAFCKEVGPEAIVNAAGIVDAAEDLEQNYIFTKNILESVVESGLSVRRIVVSGSSSEYGIVDTLPVDEEAPLRPQSAYAQSKLKETAFALDFSREYKLPVVVARIFNPIGPGMKDKFLLPTIIRQVKEIAQGSRQALEVNRLDAQRDYIDVRDLASAIRQIIEKDIHHAVYNVGSGVATSTQELIDLVLSNRNISTKPIVMEKFSTPEPMLASMANVSRIQEDLNWRPQISLSETIGELVNEKG